MICNASYCFVFIVSLNVNETNARATAAELKAEDSVPSLIFVGFFGVFSALGPARENSTCFFMLEIG